MIGFLTGKLHSKDETRAIIDVNGVGYEVFLAKDSLLKLGSQNTTIELEIYTHITESSFQLYGFQNTKEKFIFQKLISVSGVGPKLALSILSAMPMNSLLVALREGNLVVLTSISGVGKKTAERIVVELRDKFKDEGPLTPLVAANDDEDSDYRLRDVSSALVSLGYPEGTAKKVVNGLEVTEGDTIQSLIKKSLLRMQG